MKTSTFNEVSDVARRASLKFGNWLKTLVVVKNADPDGYGWGYTFYPGDKDQTGVQAAYRLGRRVR